VVDFIHKQQILSTCSSLNCYTNFRCDADSKQYYKISKDYADTENGPTKKKLLLLPNVQTAAKIALHFTITSILMH
jgi:hypothetical protein